MIIQKVLHPVVGFTLFMIGMILGVNFHFYFAIISIIGGLMLGFSSMRHDIPYMNKQAKLLFYGTFVFFALLFTSAIFFVNMFGGVFSL